MGEEISAREQAALDYFHRGFNCCQSVLMAYKDILGMDEDTVLRIGTGLGGGFSRTRELCGTVSAMGIIAGFLSPSTDPENRVERTQGYALVQQFASTFRDVFGSIVCRELLGKPAGWESPEPSSRTPEFYRSRPCDRFVMGAARILEDYLQSK